jgi:hypothetical protein
MSNVRLILMGATMLAFGAAMIVVAEMSPSTPTPTVAFAQAHAQALTPKQKHNREVLRQADDACLLQNPTKGETNCRHTLRDRFCYDLQLGFPPRCGPDGCFGDANHPCPKYED